jgi:hypothetical protein
MSDRNGLRREANNERRLLDKKKERRTQRQQKVSRVRFRERYDMQDYEPYRYR